MLKSFRSGYSNLNSVQKFIFISSVLLFSGSIILLVWPYTYSVNYLISPPNQNYVKYKVSKPELLLDKEIATSNENVKQTEKKSKEIEIGNQTPVGNRLVIPKIGVDSRILEGDNLDILDREEGVWRESFTGNPLSNSNMVIAGHRFQYLPPNTNTFYNLNKLNKGDKIIVFWQDGKEIRDFVYQVYDKLLVTPEEIYVRNYDSTKIKEITLYTCGPEVGQNDKRIVLKAQLII